MAEFDSWGAERSGVRIAEKDILDRALQQLQMREVQERIPMYAAHGRLYDAQARNLDEKTQAAKADAEALQRWAQGRGQSTPQGGVDPQTALQDDLISFANLELSRGRVDNARQIANTLSQIDVRTERQAMIAEQTAKLQFEQQQARNKLGVQLARGAKSQADWDLAKRLYEQQTGEEAPALFNSPFDPAARDRLVQGMLTEAEAARIAYQDRQAAAAEQRNRIAGASVALRNRIHREMMDFRRAREKRLEKAGDRAERAPTPAERDAVNALIKQEFPDIDPTNLRVAGTSIVSEAKRLLRNNKGLTLQQALAQSFSAQRNDFKQEAGVSIGGLSFGKKRVTFMGTGRRPREALALPETGNPVAGKYYRNAAGQVKQYTERGWVDATEDDDEED